MGGCALFYDAVMRVCAIQRLLICIHTMIKYYKVSYDVCLFEHADLYAIANCVYVRNSNAVYEP